MTQNRSARWILSALFVAALFVAALAAGCGGQDTPDVSSPGAMTGEVVKVDAMNRSIEVKGAVGETGVYYLDEGTQILSGGTKITFQDLMSGSQVTIDASAKSGRMVASYVEVVDE